MVETGSHYHNHNHQPPPPQGGLPPILGSAKGPVYPPAEQLLQLQYCIHSNPSWHVKRTDDNQRLIHHVTLQ